ncbi:MAG TPA: metal-dependent transcriptional regulator [bacterium]|nr:metal-dependent transcriptional regulator [bacterium]
MAQGNQSVKTRITSNMEDYLEAVFELAQVSGAAEVRVSDLARKLRVTRPSVVGMIKHLVKHGLVVHAHYGGIELTGMGKAVACEMWERHQLLRRFLEEVLGLDAEIAEQDGCRMEHTLSRETIDRFIALEEFRQARGQEGLGSEPFRRFLIERRLSRGRSGKSRAAGKANRA